MCTKVYNRPLATSRYTLNLEKANALLEIYPALEKPSDLFCKVLHLNNETQTLCASIQDPALNNHIGFQNNWRSKQRDLLRFIETDEWYFGTTHQSPQQRLVNAQTLQDLKQGRQFINHSIDHVRQYMGVLDTSKQEGVIALDNPRSYGALQSAGHVCSKLHPSLLWRLRFPKHVSAQTQRAYMNNIRMWSLLINKTMRFADDVTQHSDAIYFSNPKEIKALGGKILDLLCAGRKKHQEYIPAHHISPLEASVHLPINLGLNVPLNEQVLTKLYGQEAWFLVQRLTRESRNFWRVGRYADAYPESPHSYTLYAGQARMAKLCVAPENLNPFSENLIFPLWNSQQVIIHLANYVHNGQPWDHWQANNQLADIIGFLKYALLESLGFADKQHIPPRILRLFDQLIATIRNVYHSEEEFISRIEPILAQIQHSIEQDVQQEACFFPPQMLASLIDVSDEQVGLELMGQLLHIDLLNLA